MTRLFGDSNPENPEMAFSTLGRSPPFDWIEYQLVPAKTSEEEKVSFTRSLRTL